jgi:hypothetical protein
MGKNALPLSLPCDAGGGWGRQIGFRRNIHSSDRMQGLPQLSFERLFWDKYQFMLRLRPIVTAKFSGVVRCPQTLQTYQIE